MATLPTLTHLSHAPQAKEVAWFHWFFTFNGLRFHAFYSTNLDADPELIIQCHNWHHHFTVDTRADNSAHIDTSLATTFSDILPPSMLQRIEEPDKPFFLGWRRNPNGQKPSKANLEKTRLLLNSLCTQSLPLTYDKR